MKLYIMRCIKDPELLPEEGGYMLGREEYFVKIENKEEFKAYERTHNSNLTELGQAYNEGYWDAYMTNVLESPCSEGDVYFYIQPLDGDVEIGETYTDADDLVWERVK